MSGQRSRTPDDTADMHGVDPWAHSAPLDAGPQSYEEPTAYGRPPPYRPDYGPPRYGPPDDFDDDVAEGTAHRPGMSRLAIAGTVAAILVSIGLIVSLLSPVFAGKQDPQGSPRLPGVLDSPANDQIHRETARRDQSGRRVDVAVLDRRRRRLHLSQ